MGGGDGCAAKYLYAARKIWVSASLIKLRHLDSDAGPCAGPALCDGFPAHLCVIPPEADAGHAVLEELLQVVCVRAGHPQRTLAVGLAGEIPLDGQSQSTLQRCLGPIESQRVLVQPAGPFRRGVS